MIYEASRGGLDFTKDDENINSQPFMRWRDRFMFSIGAVQRAMEATGEHKGHYIYFDQDSVSLPGVMPVASGGIHAGQMHQLLHYLGEDVVLQFGGGTIGHPMGIAAGAEANRVALKRMIKAGNEGVDYLKEGPEILKKLAKTCASLQSALDTWGEISFDYESNDTADVAPTPTNA